MYKYLYGKWDVFRGLVEGNFSIWFCDICYYFCLENNEMCDDEVFKKFEFLFDFIKLNFVGIDLVLEDIILNIKFNLLIRYCFCICFSNKKNDKELFDKFNVDVCIEFNVNFLINFMKFIFEDSFGGEVIVKDVKYYIDNVGLLCLLVNEVVFIKYLKY